LSPTTARRRRRRTAAMRSRSLSPRLSQSRLGAGASAISAPGHREAAAARAQCIPTLDTAPRNVVRSSSLRNALASDASSRPRTAPRPDAGLVRRGSMTTKWPRESESSGINHPRGTSRTSSLEIPTLGMTTTAARSCTSCTARAGNSPLIGTSSPCAVRSCRQLQGSRRLPHINDGEAPPPPSGHLIAPTIWQGPAYCHSSPLLSSPTCGCTMC
jgi:hypothetical protein